VFAAKVMEFEVDYMYMLRSILRFQTVIRGVLVRAIVSSQSFMAKSLENSGVVYQKVSLFFKFFF